MNKLFDLRFVIGCFFGITGLLLVVYGLMEERGSSINKGSGIGFLLFSIVMLVLSLRSKKQED